MAYIPHGSRRMFEEAERYENERLFNSLPISVQEKVREEQKRTSDKSTKIFAGLVGAFIIAGAGYLTYHIISELVNKNAGVDFSKERDNLSAILINNGEVTINNDVTKSSFFSNNDYKDSMGKIKFHNEINSVEYEISYYDSKALVIYTFDEDDSNRKSVTDYIVSTITIDENNYIYFNPDDLTDEGYQKYINSVINSNEQDVQRTRKEN